ncbi:MAG: CDP-glucose 4,6-dehydratase [Elusimicrobiota bacterium]|jgi:CDP-glucose 4,6-dehydratase|nr:CDP-glucose 4,6-dehydratase [Elusimicrobiota bacterium]
MLDFYKNKKVFITGHTGFKGAWLCRILSLMEADIAGYALPPQTNSSLFELADISKSVNSIFADIRYLESLKQSIKTAKPEILIHLAAQPLVRESYKNPVYTYETNVMGTINVLEVVRTCPSLKSVLIVTTDKVYKNFENEQRGYKETDELNGGDPYSNSKSCAELATASYKKSFFDNSSISVSTVRSGNVIGGGDFAPDRIIPDAIRALQAQKPLILRYPNSIRPYQFVLEALFAYLLIIKKQYENKSFEGNYNVGPEISDCIKTCELVDMFYSYFENAKWKIQNNNEPHEAGFLKLDNTKIKETLGWQPRINIQQAVKMSADWTKAYLNKENYNVIADGQIKNYFVNIAK